MSKILFFSNHPLIDKKKCVTGPELRILRLASQLVENGHTVSVAEPISSGISAENYNLNFLTWSKRSIKQLARNFDTVVIPQWGRASFSYFKSEPPVPTVVDLYCPILVESLFGDSSIVTHTFARALPRIARALQKGDFFICATERQFYYYLGMLSILGRINPLTCDQNILSLVPYCVPNEPPKTGTPILRGKFVGKTDKILLWCGGLYSWFDFNTLLHAMEIVIDKMDDVKLVVVGAKNPKAEFLSSGDQEALNLVKENGWLDKHIFFLDWMPFQDLEQIYNESDLAISLHGLHLETILSFRTRVIDYLWGGLPVISTEGDELAEIISKRNAGVVVSPNDHQHVAESILTILGDKKLRYQMALNARHLAVDKFSVKSAIQPLTDFCKNPVFSEDKLDSQSYNMFVKRVQPKINHAVDALLLLHYAKKTYRGKGGISLIRKAIEFSKFG